MSKGFRRLRSRAARGTRPRSRGCQLVRSAWPWVSLAGHTRPPGPGPDRRRRCPTATHRCSSPRASQQYPRYFRGSLTSHAFTSSVKDLNELSRLKTTDDEGRTSFFGCKASKVLPSPVNTVGDFASA